MPDADRCCGFGGTFMAKLRRSPARWRTRRPPPSRRRGRHGDGVRLGCLMNISDALRRRGTTIRVAHIAQLLAEGL